jgi:hypothetical protein
VRRKAFSKAYSNMKVSATHIGCKWTGVALSCFKFNVASVKVRTFNRGMDLEGHCRVRAIKADSADKSVYPRDCARFISTVRE